MSDTGDYRLRAANVSAVTRIAKKRKKAPHPLSAVTTPFQHIESSREITTEKTVEGHPKTPLDPRIVPNAKWPGMYRIRLPDGLLSDMAKRGSKMPCAQRVTAHRLGRYRGQHEPGNGPLAAREFRDRIVGLDRLLRPQPPPSASLALCRRHGLLQDGLSRCRFPRHSLARA